jgi:hypothetical protein
MWSEAGMPSAQGLTDLTELLRTMRPELAGTPFVFCSLPAGQADGLDFRPLCVFREAEGVSVIVERDIAARRGWPAGDAWARITLRVHSSLHAVGFLAAVTGVLAREGISVNPVSACHHDHLFVPWENRERAMEILQALSRRPPDAGG